MPDPSAPPHINQIYLNKEARPFLRLSARRVLIDALRLLGQLDGRCWPHVSLKSSMAQWLYFSERDPVLSSLIAVC